MVSSATSYGPSYGNYTPSRSAVEETSRRTIALTSNFDWQSSARPQARQGGGLFGAISAVGRGIVNGAVNTVKGLMTPKGLLMLGAGVALTVATGGAAVPFLVGAGVAMGGMQVASNGVKAVQLYSQGRGAEAERALEGVGEGLFTVGVSVAGARFGPKQIKAADGTVFRMPNLVQNEGSMLARTLGTGRNYLNMLSGKTPLTAANGQSATLYQLAKGNAIHFSKSDPIALSIRATVGDLLKGAGNRNATTTEAAGSIAQNARGFSAARIRAARAVVNEYRHLNQLAGNHALTPLEQAKLNVFCGKISSSDIPFTAFNGGKLSPAQILYGAFKTYPDATLATGGAIGSYRYLSGDRRAFLA